MVGLEAVEGVAVIEIKSGYGLEQNTELRMLRAARRIGRLRPVLVRTSFLAAHAVPVEYMGRADAYIDQVCIPALYSAHVEGRDIAPVDPRLRGSRLLEVTFHDAEAIVGLCMRYPPNRPFFFLVPVDAESNNVRILVNAAQVKEMRLVETPNA